jgi:probable F420-dependent oxidoreductase
MSAPGKQKRRYWGTVMPAHADIITAMAKQAEDQGLEGVFAPQVWGPPFTALAVAAAATKEIKIASGIAIAAARSPFETAVTAIDLDRISNGRFILGLGTSVAAITTGMFGSPEIKPLAHMRETIAAIRHIFNGAHKGLEPFEGHYFSSYATSLAPMAPPLRENIPIWLAALRGPAVRLAAEVADGVMGHPIWSVEWAVENIQPDLAKGLDKAGRDRSEIDLNLWFFCAPNEDEKEAIEDGKGTVAMYAGAAQYQSFFDAHGFGEEARKIQQAAQSGQNPALVVPDEMVKAFVICGKPDYVRKRIEQAWTVADSMSVGPPYVGVSAEKMMNYQGVIANLLYQD